MFLLIAFLIFTGALGAAAYYVWSVPQKHSEDILSARLRELRLSGGGFVRTSSDLVRREQRGPLAPLGDFVEWIGVLRRLQELIDQANLKYRNHLCLDTSRFKHRRRPTTVRRNAWLPY